MAVAGATGPFNGTLIAFLLAAGLPCGGGDAGLFSWKLASVMAVKKTGSVKSVAAAGEAKKSGPVRIGFLGPEYSYSHIAALHQFSSKAELIPLPTIKAVFEAQKAGTIHFGVVPLENSTDGRIVDTMGMFVRMPVKVTAEVPLRIHHTLLSMSPKSSITEIYSKPQAISQCRDWLAANLPKAKLLEMSSTTAAAELASKKPGVAAIASREAGEHYGLKVLAANIEDNKDNVTRFAVLGETTPAPTGNDKTALMMSIPHQSGALADVMMIFKMFKLNMTWIESFPMPNKHNQYLFFIEFEGHADDTSVRKALTALAKKTVRLDVLGSFAKGKPVG